MKSYSFTSTDFLFPFNAQNLHFKKSGIQNVNTSSSLDFPHIVTKNSLEVLAPVLIDSRFFNMVKIASVSQTQ
jgi:hypothetical protein